MVNRKLYHDVPSIYSGYKIIEDDSMVITYDHYMALRTWKERLFERPWEPWRVFKVVANTKPDPTVLIHGDKLICHPQTAIVLREKLRSGALC